jgi:hypothetical protein
MHDSMMIADVGGIVNVSGRRIATPLAPPQAGEHADEHPEQDAEEHEGQILPGQRHHETLHQVADVFHPFSRDPLCPYAALD